MFMKKIPAFILGCWAITSVWTLQADMTIGGGSVGDDLTVTGITVDTVTVEATGANSLIIDASGSIVNVFFNSDFAVVLEGDLALLNNAGSIISVPTVDQSLHGAVDMAVDAVLTSFINSGTILGDHPTDPWLDAVSIEGTVISFNNTLTGILTGEDDGFRLDANAGATAGTVQTFLNAGSITGVDDDGIQIDNGATVNDLSNSGTIDGQGDSGIELDAGSTIGTLDNSGLIQGALDGFYQSDNSVVTTLTNSGTIEGLVDSGIEVRDSSSIVTLTNSNTVRGGVDGFYLDDSSITSLNNSGTIEGGSDNGIALDIGSSIGTLTNTGTVQGGDDAIQLEDGSTIGLLLNQSNILAQGGAGDKGVRIRSGSSITTLRNEGLISAFDDALALTSASSITSLINSGQLQGLNDAGVQVDSSSIGTLSNSGSISGDIDGLRMEDSSITLLENLAGGSITSDSGDAIDLVNDTTIGQLTNAGLIQGDSVGFEATGALTVVTLFDNSGQLIGGDWGMLLDTGASITTLDNSGLILGQGNDGILLNAASIGSLDNSGTIEGAGPSGVGTNDTSGIKLLNGASIGTLINSSFNSLKGTDHGLFVSGSTVTSLNNTGLIYGGDSPSTTSNDDDSGITVTGAGSVIGTLTNSGTISGFDGDANGRGIHITAGGEITTLTNTGTIIGDSYSLQIDGGNAITLNNSGVLSGDLDFGATASTLNLSGSGGRIIGDTLGASTVVNLDGSFATEGTFSVSEFLIAPTGGLALNHDLTAVGASGLTNQGRLELSPGAINSLTVTGDFTQTASGTLVVDYDGSIGAGNEGTGSDLLTVIGDAVVDGSVEFRSGTSVDIASSSPIRIIDASAGSASFSGSVIAAPGTFGDLSSFGGIYTDTLGLFPFATEPDPVAVSSTDTVVLDSAALFMGAGCGLSAQASGRMSQGRRFQHGSCLTPSRIELGQSDAPLLWTRVISRRGNQDARNGVSGYDYRTQGVVIGSSQMLNEDWSSGFSLGVLSSWADKDIGGTDSADSYYLGWQADYQNDQQFVNLGLMLGYNQFDFERMVALDGSLTEAGAETEGWSFGARVASGFEQPLNEHAWIKPTLSLNYIELHKSGYREQGLGQFNLKVEDETLKELRAGASVEVAHDFVTEKASKVPSSSLSVQVGLSRRLAMDDREYDAAFTGIGGPFVIEGDDSHDTLYHLGVGWTGHLNEQSNLFVGYDAAFGSDREEHQINFGFRTRW